MNLDLCPSFSGSVPFGFIAWRLVAIMEFASLSRKAAWPAIGTQRGLGRVRTGGRGWVNSGSIPLLASAKFRKGKGAWSRLRTG